MPELHSKTERFVETGKALQIEPPLDDEEEGGIADSPFGKQALLRMLQDMGWRISNISTSDSD